MTRARIWGRYQGRAEVLDECDRASAGALAAEYRLAFGTGWVIWIGSLVDEPERVNDSGDQTTG